ncbi:helix-turn-helix domain-containing protein [Mucilaginibacter gilvus]|uniref:AraC family transcriptional regulator n=1 Tax=Mucilaginibacter gilvus TaxID=2305909 RepID=A0A3S3UVH7_9SPHI|nr:helix-turn-helix transcriptional regulator [Mucilaginibacter gilvus]RWY51613.1 AraC family transcriptional regulator [Mucilaginibacter gilvus]
MAKVHPKQVKTISEFHSLQKLTKPEHPLISLVNFEDIKYDPNDDAVSLVMGFYSIGLKRNFNAKMKYGQQTYDFDEGMMTFLAPGQLLRIDAEPNTILEHSGWLLLIHPDFLWNNSLAEKIRRYDYFSYSINEALHLSDREEAIIIAILKNIAQEYRSNIDRFSQDLIITQVELLLTYAERFYHRQFLTRKISNHQLLDRMETLLNGYFEKEALLKNGVPSVTGIAEGLNVSPNYLGSLLKLLTGQSTQQHIHDRLIRKAKEKLSTTALSISEVAYSLGFEHPQSFTKLFKAKTDLSPIEFRKSFN